MAHRSFGSIAIVLNLLNQQGQIVERLDIQFRPILTSSLWLGCRDWNQKADAVQVLHFIRHRESASAMTAPTDDVERFAEQWMRLILHRHVDDGRFVRLSGGDIPMYPRSKASTGAHLNTRGGRRSRAERQRRLTNNVGVALQCGAHDSFQGLSSCR